MIIRIVMNRVHDKDMNADTESLILKAAEREFLCKGFMGARTTSIAEAAGVTHAMFHYYFRTKKKLFERIMAEKIGLLKEVIMGSIVDMEAPLSEILRRVISNHLEFIAANPDLPRFLIGEIYSNPERSATFLENLRRFAPQFIDSLQKKIEIEASRGCSRRVDASMLMLDIVSLNVFSYIAAPAVNAALGDCMADAEAFLQRRKEENYDTIMRKLKP